MDLFDRFKADRVACDEVLTVRDVEKAVPISAPLPPDSFIDPGGTRIDVAVVECDLVSDLAGDRFFVDLDLLIEKEIRVCRPGSTCLPLEFSFVKSFKGLAVTGCRPSQIPAEILRRLHCQVFDLQATDALSLDAAAGSFSETLTATVVVKIVFEDQIPVPTPGPPGPPGSPGPPGPSGPPGPPTPPAPPAPPEVITALEIVAGKIRAVIGDQAFKERLLREIARAEELLESGLILEAVAILADVVDELQAVFNASPGRRIPFNLVLSDLVTAKKQVVGLL